MHRQGRKRKVGTVTPPDGLIASACRTPSPKRHKDHGITNEDFHAYNGQAVLRDNSYKVFNDSIHGHIEVHPLCVKIIDTPQFQRLRNIKQLGACYYVFPGASHNRFEHCIGTCHLAGKLVRSLQKRQPELGITDEDVLCIKIAGLCHDLGHGPFSHMFDSLFIPFARPDTDWKHEDASVNMFDHMMKVNNLLPSFREYNLSEKDLIFIKELIAGTALVDTSNSQEWPFKGREPEKRYLYEIVANKRTGIDVDKFDYFSRDCHNLGISNSFDHKRYLKFARIIDVKGNLQICVRDKEAGNIYDMFHTRNSLFRRAYQHKTSNIIERMITEALLKADKKIRFKGSNGKMLSISESIDDMEAYTMLTDQVYYQILCSSDPELQEARSILVRIQRRDLYKCIGQAILKKRREKEEIPDIKQDMAECIDGGPHIEPDDFIIELVTFDYGMRDRNPIDEVRFYGKNNPDKPMIVRKEEVSNMLPEMFAEQHIRVYFRKNEPQCLEKSKRCFIRWCQGQQCTTPKTGDDLAELTPMKSSQETGHGNMERRLSFQE
ncbi:deoxynucleoside triphosphate triphosphohydrolase SAMHD1-like [Porites lutea]|uniref:deoxynucleoside triphosphate triphosphohydrolase SAMHD1-like n=1 Tax=Porites lutea TaxID=51062 RepID=UPI003CC6B547